MTLAEFNAAVAAAKAKGHEYLQVTLARKQGPRYWDRARMWRGGPRCRFIAETEPGRWLVDVKIADLESALKRLDAGAEPATERVP